MGSAADPFWFAYRMLGSVGAATGILTLATEPGAPQELAALAEPAMHALREIAHDRTEYAGPWLPEPVELDPDDGPDITSLPFLLGLDRLSPTERAVYLLTDVHTQPAADVAAAVGRDETSCAALLAKARAKVAANRPPIDESAGARAEIAERFLTAGGHGDLTGLRALLARDVAWYGDAGGVVGMKALQNEVAGVDHVLRLLIVLLGHSGRPEAVALNGQPGLLTVAESGAVTTASTLQIHGGHVVAVHCVANAAKLIGLQHRG